jgi:hypothetical protein
MCEFFIERKNLIQLFIFANPEAAALHDEKLQFPSYFHFHIQSQSFALMMKRFKLNIDVEFSTLMLPSVSLFDVTGRNH